MFGDLKMSDKNKKKKKLYKIVTTEEPIYGDWVEAIPDPNDPYKFSFTIKRREPIKLPFLKWLNNHLSGCGIRVFVIPYSVIETAIYKAEVAQKELLNEKHNGNQEQAKL